jgi:poly(hydroxyalkanoate) depolymerase family esterase
MNPSFRRLMAETTRLTRAGDLRGATAAIQAALRGTAAPTGPARPAGSAVNGDVDVIDVEAHEVATDDAAAQVWRAPTPTPAPTKSAPAPGAGEFLAGSFTDSNGTRDYKLYIPPGDGGGPELPLVVMLHGCTQNPDDFAAGTGMNDAARERGFYVLYPAQAQKANPSRCWNWFKHNHQQRGRGEPALLAGMTRDVISRHPIDPRCVYVAGLSAGGAMAAILGDAYPDLFAAVGVHSGLPTGSARDVTSAMAAMKVGATVAASSANRPPTIVFHGDQDTTVHPVNGEQVVSAGVEARAVKPERERGRVGSGREYTRRCYRGASDRVVAEHWTVHGAGHAWSGGNAAGSYTDPKGPDATTEMLRFFLANSLRQPP